jgi:hypothetical protein
VRDQLWQARWCHCDNSTQHAWDCYSTGSMVSQESLGLLALQLWTLLRFILLEYIITAAGPLKHTSTSASVVWAPCMTLLSSRCALYYLQKINQSLHLAQHKKPINVCAIIHPYVFPAYSATYTKTTRRWWISDACHHVAITVVQLFLVPAD